MSDDSNYVCSLQTKEVKKAKEELFENPEDRLAAVQAFRDWINEQSHIRCPKTDTLFLLAFLRWAKWSQIRARERLEAYLALIDLTPTVYAKMDTKEANMAKIIEAGWITIIPKRDPSGCAVALMNCAALKLPIKFPDYFRVMALAANYWMKSEETQVNGVIFVCDWSGINAAIISKIMGIEAAKIQKNWVSRMPGRWKHIHFYRAGVLFETIFTFFKSILPKKIISRIKSHDTMESIYKELPMECLPAEYLPDDYTGPNAGTIKELSKNFISAIREKEFREDLMYKSSKSFGIDESKKKNTETVTQHFRKLNVD